MPGAPSVVMLPRSVNPRKFAFQDTRLDGKVDPQELQRLADAVVAVCGVIDARLHFYVDDGGKAVVEGGASADVVMTCQRCLEEVTQTVSADIRLALVQSDEQSRNLPKDFDPWLIESEDGTANLYAMLEDELLLALPMVALHEEFCIDSALLSTGELSPQTSKKDKANNPFDVLKQLKTKISKLD